MINDDVAYFALCEKCHREHGFLRIPKLGQRKIDFASKEIGFVVVDLCLERGVIDGIEAEFMKDEITNSDLQDGVSFADFLLVARSLGVIVSTDIRMAREFGTMAIQRLSEQVDQSREHLDESEIESLRRVLRKTHYIH